MKAGDYKLIVTFIPQNEHDWETMFNLKQSEIICCQLSINTRNHANQLLFTGHHNQFHCFRGRKIVTMNYSQIGQRPQPEDWGTGTMGNQCTL